MYKKIVLASIFLAVFLAASFFMEKIKEESDIKTVSGNLLNSDGEDLILGKKLREADNSNLGNNENSINRIDFEHKNNQVVVPMNRLNKTKNHVYDCYEHNTNRYRNTTGCIKIINELKRGLKDSNDYDYVHFAISALHTELDPFTLSDLINSYISRNSKILDDDDKFNLWLVAFSASATADGAEIFYDKYNALDKYTKVQKLNEVLLISQQYLARNETRDSVRKSVKKVIDICKKSHEGIPVGCAYFNYLKVTSALENEYNISSYIVRKILSERNPYTVVVLLDEMSYMCEDLGSICDDLRDNTDFRTILLEGSMKDAYSESDREMFRTYADSEFS